MNKRKLIATFPELPEGYRWAVSTPRFTDPMMTVKVKKRLSTVSSASDTWYYEDPDAMRALALTAHKRAFNAHPEPKEK